MVVLLEKIYESLETTFKEVDDKGFKKRRQESIQKDKKFLGVV